MPGPLARATSQGRSTTNDTTRTKANVTIWTAAPVDSAAAAAAASAATPTNTSPKCGTETSTITAKIASANQASAGHSNNDIGRG